ncbi:MAG: transglycosylase SLT domain-containing protein [Leptospiraceae bacterium]|nr:transglycosylase SLT domain-containing protein [Leptospiraceae bacterium]MCP5498139.1 transglycosylase SLT domain-containing protein [Leptospiraceae bacterium]
MVIPLKLLILLLILVSCNIVDDFQKSDLSLKFFKLNNHGFYVYPNEKKYNQIIKRESEKHKIDWMFVKSVIIKESHYSEYLVSNTGAVGLMQLMPRKESYITENYNNFIKARKQKKNRDGERVYKGKTAEYWGLLYRKDLLSLYRKYKKSKSQLYKIDKRFNPKWNIIEGVRHLAIEYHYFKKRNGSNYKTRILASSSYNAGRRSVIKHKNKPEFDSIPINGQTEIYSIAVNRIYNALKHGDGQIHQNDIWVLYQ